MTLDVARVPARVRAWWFPMLTALVVIVSVVWGWRVEADPNTNLGAAPLVGRWRVRFGLTLVPAAVLAAGVAWWGPRLAQRLRFGSVALGAALSSLAFTLLLAASDGWGHVLDPVVHPGEYWANLAALPPAATMLRRYGTYPFLVSYSEHAMGHPPGFLLLLKGLHGIGLGHPWAAGALSYIGVVAVVVAGLYTVRVVAGGELARGAAPFLVVAPYVVWMGTSADAFYAGVGAVGVLLVVEAHHRGSGARRLVLAFGAGLVFGALLFLTYGAAVFGVVPIVVAVGLTTHDRRSLAVVSLTAAAGVVAVVVAFRLAGFWWFDGLAVTRRFYWGGTAHFRPAGYFAIGNLGAACIAVGPATVLGLSRLRNRRLWLLVGAGALCVVVADASQYSKAEVERIWLLFYPWLVLAAVALGRPRRWLGAQAALAIGLQVALVSKW